jgi:hypothetical protein
VCTTAIQEGSPSKSCQFLSFHFSWTAIRCHHLTLSISCNEHIHSFLYPANRHRWPQTKHMISFSQRTVIRKHLHVTCSSYLRSSYVSSCWSKAFGEGSHQDVHIIWITAVIIQNTSAIFT